MRATSADQRAYTQNARAQRNKGFEKVEVSFEHDGQYATAKRRRPRREAAGTDGGPPDSSVPVRTATDGSVPVDRLPVDEPADRP